MIKPGPRSSDRPLPAYLDVYRYHDLGRARDIAMDIIKNKAVFKAMRDQLHKKMEEVRKARRNGGPLTAEERGQYPGNKAYIQHLKETRPGFKYRDPDAEAKEAKRRWLENLRMRLYK